jgi:hypothetical protein
MCLLDDITAEILLLVIKEIFINYNTLLRKRSAYYELCIFLRLRISDSKYYSRFLLYRLCLYTSSIVFSNLAEEKRLEH